MQGHDDLSLPRRLRLCGRREFEQLFKQGRRAADQRLSVWALRNDLGYSRLGLVVGRKHGGAVQRNRIKRVLREAFRLSRSELPRGLDIVCTPRVGADITLSETIESLARITGRLARALRLG
jgi:ribonuclease P protein component